MKMLWKRFTHNPNKHVISTNFNLMHGNIRDWLLCGTKHTLETMLRDTMYAVNRKCILLLPDMLAKDN